MTSTYIISTISGGHFVSQTAILATILPAINNQVDAYFGNSGGAIANLIALKFSGTSESIERVVYSIDKDIFVKPWVSDNMPLSKVLSPFISLFTNSFYKDSKGPKELMNVFYTKEELKKAEMWIGKFDINANFNHLLCSKQEGQSIFNQEISDTYNITYLQDMTGSYNIEYANGDIDTISNTLNATSAIPGYKPPIEINGTLFVDGGVSSPSPGSAFTNIFLQNAATKISGDANHKFRMFYNIGVKSIDTDIEYVKPTSHWSSQIFRTLKSLLNFSINKERQLIFDTWLQMCGQNFYNSSNVTFVKVTGKDALKTQLDTISDKHYFVTCYSVDDSVNVLNFDKNDLKRVYKNCYDNVFFEIYYIP